MMQYDILTNLYLLHILNMYELCAQVYCPTILILLTCHVYAYLLQSLHFVNARFFVCLFLYIYIFCNALQYSNVVHCGKCAVLCMVHVSCYLCCVAGVC